MATIKQETPNVPQETSNVSSSSQSLSQVTKHDPIPNPDSPHKSPESDVGHSAHARPYPCEQELSVSSEDASNSKALGVAPSDCLKTYFSTPCRVSNPEWSKTNSVGDVLAIVLIKPTTEHIDNGSIHQTNLSHFARFSTGYRGTLKCSIEPQPCPMHGGSLYMCFVPGTGPTPTLSQARTLNGITINISKHNSDVIDCSWVSARDYLPVDTEIGRVVIYVLNILRAPATASSTIDLNIDLFAGSDFHFVIPKPGPQDLLYPVHSGTKDHNTIPDLIDIPYTASKASIPDVDYQIRTEILLSNPGALLESFTNETTDVTILLMYINAGGNPWSRDFTTLPGPHPLAPNIYLQPGQTVTFNDEPLHIIEVRAWAERILVPADYSYVLGSQLSPTEMSGPTGDIYPIRHQSSTTTHYHPQTGEDRHPESRTDSVTKTTPLIDTWADNLNMPGKNANIDPVIESEYILATDKEITITDINTIVDTLPVDDIISDEDLAPIGILRYHHLRKLSYKCKIILTNTHMMSGRIALAYIPSDYVGTPNLYAGVRNFPHVFIDLAAQSDGEFTIPYTAFTRILESGAPSMGNIVVFIYNRLRSVDDTTITYTITLRPIKAMVGVRTVPSAGFKPQTLPSTTHPTVTDWITTWKEICDKYDYTTTFTYKPFSKGFSCDLKTSQGYKVRGLGLSKKAARSHACHLMVHKHFPVQITIPDQIEYSPQTKEPPISAASDAAKEEPQERSAQEGMRTTTRGSYLTPCNKLSDWICREDQKAKFIHDGPQPTDGYVYRGSRTLGGNQRALLTTWLYQSGNISYKVNTSYARNGNVMCAAINNIDDTTQDGVDSTTVADLDELQLANVTYWQAGVEPNKVINCPQQVFVPLIRTSATNAGSIGVHFQGEDGATITHVITAKADKKFSVYFPLAPPVLTEAPARDLTQKRQRSHKSIILSGDVETNPGPVFSRSFITVPFAPQTSDPFDEDDAESDQSEMNSGILKGIFSAISGFFTSSANAIMEAFQYLKQKPKDLFNSLFAKAASLFVDHLSKEILERVTAFIESVTTIIKNLLLGSWLIRQVYLCWNGNITFADVTANFLLFFSTDVGDDFRQDFLATFSWLTKIIPQTKDQEADDHLKIYSSIGAVLTSLFFGSVGVAVGPHRDHIAHIIANCLFREAGRDIYTCIKWVFTKVVDYFFNGVDAPSAKTAAAQLKDLESQVTPLLAQFYDFKARNLFSGQGFVETTDDSPTELLQRCLAMCTFIREPLSVVSTYPRWSRWITDVEETWAIARKTTSYNTSRPEPVGILMSGPPGCGKSYASTTVLPELVLLRTGLILRRCQAQGFSYTFPNDPNQNFADGYWGQIWAGIEEIGSMKKSGIWSKLINYISTASAAVNQAAIPDKGQLFLSAFLCGTTNLKSFTVAEEDLHNKEALIRRFPIAVEMNVHDEFKNANGTLDFGKLTAELAKCADASDPAEAELNLYGRVWTIHKLDVASGTTSSKQITFAQYVDWIVFTYLSHKKVSSENNALRMAIPHKPVDPSTFNADSSVFKPSYIKPSLLGHSPKSTVQSPYEDNDTFHSPPSSVHETNPKAMDPEAKKKIEDWQKANDHVQQQAEDEQNKVKNSHPDPPHKPETGDSSFSPEQDFYIDFKAAFSHTDKQGLVKVFADYLDTHVLADEDAENVAAYGATVFEALPESESSFIATFCKKFRNLKREGKTDEHRILCLSFAARYISMWRPLRGIFPIIINDKHHPQKDLKVRVWHNCAPDWHSGKDPGGYKERPAFHTNHPGPNQAQYEAPEFTDQRWPTYVSCMDDSVQTPTATAFVDKVNRTWEWIAPEETNKIYWYGLQHARHLLDQNLVMGVALYYVISFLILWGLYALAIKLIIKLSRVICNYLFPIDPQTRYAREVKGAQRTVRKPAGIKFTPQSLDPGNDKIAHALYPFSNSSKHDVQGYAYAVDDQHVLLNNHYVEKLEKNEQNFYLQTRDADGNLGRWQEIPLTFYQRLNGLTEFQHRSGVYSLDLPDLCLLRLPLRLAAVRNSRKSFLSRSDLVDYCCGLKRLATFKRSFTTGEDDMPCVIEGFCEARSGSFIHTSISMTLQEPSEQGDCGTPYICKNDTVLGLHCGGNGKRAAVAMVTREDIEEAILFLDSIDYQTYPTEFEPIPVEPQTLQGWQVDTGFDCRGLAKDSAGEYIDAFIPYKTNKRYTDIRDTEVWPDNHRPAKLNKDLLIKRSQKYGFSKPTVPPSSIETRFAYSIFEHALTKFSYEDNSILSWDQVINGDENLNLPALTLNTSAGLWGTGEGKGKTDYFSVESLTSTGKYVYDFSEYAKTHVHPKFGCSLVDYLSKYENAIRQGKRLSDVIFTTTLKDELRPHEKVDAGKTRVFECLDLATNLLIKKYFGTFMSWYKQHAGPTLAHAIGLDKESFWHFIWQSLTANGRTQGLDGDYKEFDGSIPPAFYSFFQGFSTAFYGEENSGDGYARSALLHTLQFSQQVIAGHICQSYKGNKSGNWMTDAFNSVCNLWAHSICYHRLYTNYYGDHPMAEDWRKDVTLLTLGDDAIASCSDTTLQWFNPETISLEMYNLGLTYTSADKTSVRSGRPLTELTFLKSYFVDKGYIVLAPMPTTVHYKEMNWVKKGFSDSVTVRQGMVKDALRFSSHHGKEHYSAFAHQVRERLCNEDALSIDQLEIPSHKSWMTDIWYKQKFESNHNTDYDR